MSDYMESRKLGQTLEAIDFPGHGPGDLRRQPLRQSSHPAPHGARGARLGPPLAKGATDIPTIVRLIDIGIDPRPPGAARHVGAGADGASGDARRRRNLDGLLSIDGEYRLASYA